MDDEDSSMQDVFVSEREQRGRGRGIGAAMDVDEEGRYAGRGISALCVVIELDKVYMCVV
jgi:hypothetical protein